MSIIIRLNFCTHSLAGLSTVSLLGLVPLVAPSVDPSAIMMFIGSSFVGPAAKFAVTFPLVYHYIGGMRHLVWDSNPEMLTNEQVETSSWVVLVSAFFTSTFFVVM